MPRTRFGLHACRIRSRANKLTQETGAAKCVWKTRMGPWFAAVGLDEFSNSIHTCSSDLLQKLLVDVSYAARAGLLEALQGLRLSAHEAPTGKFVLGRHCRGKQSVVTTVAMEVLSRSRSASLQSAARSTVPQSTQARAPCCTALRIAYSDRALPRVSTSIVSSKTEAPFRSIRSRMPACRTMPLFLW